MQADVKSMPAPTEPGTAIYTPEVFSTLLAQYLATPTAEKSKRWLLLEAAHVVGQTRFGPHLKTHVLMLGQARRDGDLPEMAGQLMRLALVPLGHAAGRLPIGNPGRSNISAFKPVPVRDDIAETIAQARQGTFA